MNDLINKFIKSVKDKLIYKGDNEMIDNDSSFLDITENKRIGKNQSIQILGLSKYGKASDGLINGSCFISSDLDNGAVIIGCEGKENAKYGIIGARILKDAALNLIKSIDKESKAEEIFLKHIVSSSFKAILKAMWQELVSIHFEGLANGEEISLQEYATSLTIAIITENHYTVGGIGEGGLLLYNEFEGKRVLTGNKDALLLGEGKVSLCFKEYPRSDFGGFLFCSNKLGNLLYENKLLYRLAIGLEKRGMDTELFNNDVLKNIISSLDECGLMLFLAVDKGFRLPDEKYREYKEQIYKKQREDAEKNRNEQIAKNLELAKDKSLYDTYNTLSYKDINVFLARRQGRSHVAKNEPCQDYCLADTVSKGVILADADGLGSCKRSEFGSRFACEALVDLIKALDKQSENEEIFVSRLQGVLFRERLVNKWLGMVVDHIQENPFENENPNGYLEYASTLMFAIITDNYYVVGCLGDGQVLLFNENEGFKLRLHDSKEDSSTKSLVNHNCAREDFIIGKYNRCDFNGVLLTTDGMYDRTSLVYVNELYKYALESRKRFLEKGEPYMPFCYNLQGETVDLYSHRSTDDCSIVLAADGLAISTSPIVSLNNRYEVVIPQMLGDISTYFCKDNDGEYFVVATKKSIPVCEIAGIRQEKRIDSFTENGYFYNVYNVSPYPTLEYLYHNGELSEKSESNPNASYFVLEVYGALSELEDILKREGYHLNYNAPYLMLYDGGFVIYPESIEKGCGESNIKDYFEALLGKIVTGEREIPVFSTGFRSKGQRKYLTDSIDGPCFAVYMKDGKYYLENADLYPWRLENGNILQKGDKIPLENDLSFGIRGEGTFKFVEINTKH